VYYVYILKSENFHKSYVGCTDNLDRRIKEHNAGKMLFTRRYKPWQLIYSESFDELKYARRREYYIKTGAGRRFMKKILNNK